MYFLGPTIKVPPKSKAKLWDRLHAEIFAFRRQLADNSRVEKAKTKHALEKEIAKLQMREPNRERIKLIKKHKDMLKKYT